MTALFFDLETSALHSVGQILNYCFIAVDEQWKEVERLQGLIRISRLELPEPGAIVANRTDVFEHQRVATDSERCAVQKISQFLSRHGGQAVYNDRTPLIGYNSARFDLEKLRVAFIRNGLHPYGAVRNADLLILCRYLAATKAEFRSLLPVVKNEQGEPYIGTRLEQVTRALGLLDGAQLHESSFDVELTIKLARYFLENYQIDIRTWQPYLLPPKYSVPARPQLLTSFDAKTLPCPVQAKPYAFIREKDGYAFWVKLEACLAARREGRALVAQECVMAFKRESALVWPSGESITPEYTREFSLLAREAVTRFQAVTMDDIFPKPTCYVEAFIYLVRDTRELSTAINAGLKTSPDLMLKLSKEARTVLRRFFLENATAEEMESAELKKSFINYCRYRYGGKMQLSKSLSGLEEEIEVSAFHPTLAALLADIKTRVEKCVSDTEQKLLRSLEEYYLQSEIHTVCESLRQSANSVDSLDRAANAD